jgi:tetratricopeptide (TPR) repeat protein
MAYFRDNYNIDLQLRIGEDCPLSPDKFAKVNEAIGRCSKERKLESPLILFAAFIALCQRDPEQEEIAFSLAHDFVNANPEDPVAEDTIAGVYWALDRFDDAVRHGEEAINKASVLEIDPTKYQNSLCYWVAEAVRARMHIEEELKRKVLDLSENFSQNYPNNPQYLDTVAFVKIALGTKIKDIESGLMLTRKAWELARQNGDERTQELTHVFCKRHERLAFFKINKILSSI